MKLAEARRIGGDAMREEAKKSIFDYIDVFYNRQRKRSFLGYLTPEQYEMAYEF